jgi:hypothetical protein
MLIQIHQDTSQLAEVVLLTINGFHGDQANGLMFAFLSH